MVRELREIASSREVWNPFARSDRLTELRTRVSSFSETTPIGERFAARSDLALAELRAGSLDNGIAELLAVRVLLAEAGQSDGDLLFQLGLAHMRLAEQLNCREQPDPRRCILPISGTGTAQGTASAREAIRWFSQALELFPERSAEYVATRWLLNLAYQSAGVPRAEIPERVRLPESIFQSDQPFAQLPDVAAKLGADVFGLAGGAVVEDLDGDDRLDILTSTWQPDGALTLLVNRGDEGFENRSSAANLEGITGGLNLVHADYDNDGDFDVLILRGAWFGEEGRHPNSLLQNDGRGRFLDVTFDAGLGDQRYPTQAAAWADYDHDGDLDLYVGNEGGPGGFPSQLFRNNGDGTFVDVAGAAGVENFRFTKGVTWGDYDGDGDPDLYVSNWPGPNRLYRNNGNGTFADVAPELGVTEPIESFATWFWDFDNDGALDLYVSNFPFRYDAGLSNLSVVVASYLGAPRMVEGPRLYRGDGRGGFHEVSEAMGLTRINMPMGANFGDLDGDGFLDFYLGTGYPNYDGLIPNLLYKNLQGQRFADVTMAAGVGHLQKGHGVVFADLDNDGDLDLFEQMGGFYPDDGFRNVLYANPGSEARWLRIRLVGTRSNRAGVGARLRLRLTRDGEVSDVYRQVGMGAGFGSAPLEQHIGLGAATTLVALEVHWPASGTTQIFPNVPLDAAIEITEGEPELRRLDLPRISWR